MGSIITLGVGRLEIDWGKNSYFTNHSRLFFRDDVAGSKFFVKEYGDGDLGGRQHQVTKTCSGSTARYKTWSTRFNLDPKILGRTFILNGTACTLVGIMPPRLTKRGADFYWPVDPENLGAGDTQRAFLIQGRLKPGVTLHQVAADIEVIAHRLALVHPKDYACCVAGFDWIWGFQGKEYWCN